MMKITETIENLNDLQERDKLASHVRCGLVSSRQHKAWQMWWDIKYQMEVYKVSKTEAVKRIAALETKGEVRRVWEHLALLK